MAKISGSGRTKLNINVFKESIEKTENVYFRWHKQYNWMIPEYRRLQEELASIPPPPEKIFLAKIEDPRSLKPYPESNNQVYGWLSTKPDFRLEKFGPDLFK